MKRTFNALALIAVLALSACAGNNDSAPAPVVAQPDPGPAPIVNAPVTSNWVNTDASSRIPSLNLAALISGQVQDVAVVYDCVAALNGQPNESGTDPIDGVGLDQVELTATDDSSGSIQFGPLSHADHDPMDLCYTLGQEPFNYSISGNTLTIVDPNYPQYPSTFTAQ